jgi:hypothetical protein
LRELPILVALSLVAVVTNVTVVQRFGPMADALRARHPAPPTSPPGDDVVVPGRDASGGTV